MRQTLHNHARQLVRLTLTIAVVTASIGCGITAQTVVTFRPTISGVVYDGAGDPLAGVRLRFEDADITATTDNEGAYAVEIPYEFSGAVRPELEGFDFAPDAWTFSVVRADISNLSFMARPITSVDGGPLTTPQSISLLEDSSVSITLAADHANPEFLLFEVSSLPKHGELRANGELIGEEDLPFTITGAEPVLVYSPDEDYAGGDGFVYNARDIQTELSAAENVTLLIQPVNDPPVFKIPAVQYANAGRVTEFSIYDAAPGDSVDEAGQAVVFSVHSADQTVMPDDAISLDGDRVRLVPATAGGPVTVTVTAQDDGGTAHGGVDQAARTLELTVVTGPLVSGEIRSFELAGATTPLGEITLEFTGAGDWEGVDFQAASDLSGSYAVEAPHGWTGQVSAADPSGCLLSPAARRYDTPITAPVDGQDFSAWLPAIGIPFPEFGIFETHRSYADATYDFGDGPTAYPDAGDGPYTHYIDNTHPGATDCDNPFGTPDRPRLTTPTDWIAAGSVLEIHGGPYAPGWRVPLLAAGTAEAPVFVRGAGESAPLLSPRLAMYGRYMIVEKIRADRATIVSTNDYGDVHHVVLRHAELTGSEEDGGISVANWGDNETVSTVLIWDVDIHDMGDIDADYDQDFHGVTINSDVSHAWLLDCRILRCSGSGLQVNAGSLAKQAGTHHIYAGRNQVYECRQSGLFTKQAVDVVFSQNEIRDIITTEWSKSKGLGYQYAPENVWFLFNRVYDCEHGVCSGSDNGLGFGENIYIVGNEFSNIHDTHDDYNPGTAWSAAAIMLPGGTNRYIVNNTMCDVDAGINGPGLGAYAIQNNIISNVTRGHQVFIEHAAAAANSTLVASILHQGGGEESIRWGSSIVRTLAGLQAAIPDQGLGCFNADPLLTNPGDRDFALQAHSPAVDSGVSSDIYATFEARYGLSIAYDASCAPRPRSDDDVVAWDMGAYEY